MATSEKKIELLGRQFRGCANKMSNNNSNNKALETLLAQGDEVVMAYLMSILTEQQKAQMRYEWDDDEEEEEHEDATDADGFQQQQEQEAEDPK